MAWQTRSRFLGLFRGDQAEDHGGGRSPACSLFQWCNARFATVAPTVVAGRRFKSQAFLWLCRNRVRPPRLDVHVDSGLSLTPAMAANRLGSHGGKQTIAKCSRIYLRSVSTVQSGSELVSKHVTLFH